MSGRIGYDDLHDSKGNINAGDDFRLTGTCYEWDENNNENNPKRTFKKIKTFILLLLSCGFTLIWVSRTYFSGNLMNASVTSPESHLVKYSATSAASPTPSSAVLEVFQVYQPVLVPPGVTDETASYNGVEETATIASTSDATGCKVVLMKHTFGYSYGMPFVGTELPSYNLIIADRLITYRQLQAP